MDWKELIGKRIFVVLKSGHIYNGTVVFADDNFITIIDKMQERVTINSSEIKILKEVRG